MKKYDVIIIGSSPLCLAEAIHHARHGRSVGIIEKGTWGGSWRYMDSLGFKNVEIGPHVFNGTYKGKRALKLFNLKPVKAKIWYFDTTVNKLYKNSPSAAKHLEKMSFWFQNSTKKPINIIKAVYNAAQYVRLRFLKKQSIACYLKGGTYELIESFPKLPAWQKINVIQNECINIHPRERQNTSTDLIITLASSETLSANRVILTSSCSLNISELHRNFSNSLNTPSFEQHSFKSCQVLLLIKNNVKKLYFTSFISEPDSYIGVNNFKRLKTFKYLNDITPYVSHINGIDLNKNGLSVLTLAVDATYFTDKSGHLDFKKILNELAHLGFISPETVLIDSDADFFEGKVLNSSQVDLFNKTVSYNIKILASENLLESLAANYDRWKIGEGGGL